MALKVQKSEIGQPRILSTKGIPPVVGVEDSRFTEPLSGTSSPSPKETVRGFSK